MTTLASRPLAPSLASFGAIALLTVAAASAQVSLGGTAAASVDSGLDRSGDYRHELQSCRDGGTGQDRATCEKEARNAQGERRHGKQPAGAIDYRANALARCQVFKDTQDKADCEARVGGEGRVSGSVAGGGLLRELERVVPATQTR